MRRAELEHILRASEGITGAREFVVIGSQAILGRFPDAPAELTLSVEADVFTFRSPEDAMLIDGSIGEESPFHKMFGYFAHGVGEKTAVLPAGWKGRLVPIRSPSTGGATGLCLEPHDLMVSKLIAGREKDLAFVGAAIGHGLVEVWLLRERLGATVLEPPVRVACEARLVRLAP